MTRGSTIEPKIITHKQTFKLISRLYTQNDTQQNCWGIICVMFVCVCVCLPACLGFGTSHALILVGREEQKFHKSISPALVFAILHTLNYTALIVSNYMCNGCQSGKKKSTNPNFWVLGPDILQWGGGLPLEGVRAKKFGISLETRETKPSLSGISPILLGILGRHVCRMKLPPKNF